MKESEWNELMAPWKAQMPESINKAVGCEHCRDTGFLGRHGIYEILEMTPELQTQVMPNAHIEELRNQAYKDGMRPLRISGLTKVAQGKTSVEEILKVTPAPMVGG